jgi:hypothetical protein
MVRTYWRLCAVLVVGGLIVAACGSDSSIISTDIYVGGRCHDDADCYEPWQHIPGSFCRNTFCSCEKDMALCCPGGLHDEDGNPLGCDEHGDYRCRPRLECHPEEAAACTTAADCPPPPDLRCGLATCTDGKCGVQLLSSGVPIAWQALGDCKAAHCDASGKVIFTDDLADTPKTLNPCIADKCLGSQPMSTPVAEGEACIDTVGLCDTVETATGPVLKCVECIWPDASPCAPGEGCIQGKCVPEACANGKKDGTETGQDCGGPSCARCKVGEFCLKGADCEQGVCKSSKCVAPTHTDGVKNGTEAGVDCGCDTCGLCPNGEGCTKPGHCQSGVCYAGKCQVPTCFDMVLNGTELGIDCGGGCPLACPVQSSE